MNFFKPQPDPFDIINKKLDEILKKEDTIYGDVKNLIEIVPCEEIKSDYRNQIRVKLFNCQSVIKTHYKSSDKESAKYGVFELFRDPTESFAKIYSDMKNLEQEALIYMLNHMPATDQTNLTFGQNQ